MNRLALSAYFIVSAVACRSDNDVRLDEMSAGLQLWNCCQFYATKHDMRFPTTLDELVETEILSAPNLRQLSQSGNGPRWRYYGEGMSLENKHDELLFESVLTSKSGAPLIQAYTVSGVRSN